MKSNTEKLLTLLCLALSITLCISLLKIKTVERNMDALRDKYIELYERVEK